MSSTPTLCSVLKQPTERASEVDSTLTGSGAKVHDNYITVKALSLSHMQATFLHLFWPSRLPFALCLLSVIFYFRES